MPDAYNASAYLGEAAEVILSELADRLEGEISGKNDCALRTAISKALVRGCLVGFAAVATTADVTVTLRSGEVVTGTVVLDHALDALHASDLDHDEWAERFGDD